MICIEERTLTSVRDLGRGVKKMVGSKKELVINSGKMQKGPRARISLSKRLLMSSMSSSTLRDKQLKKVFKEMILEELTTRLSVK